MLKMGESNTGDVIWVWFIRAAGRAVMWMLMLILFLHQIIIPLISSSNKFLHHLWTLIKRYKFMYIILNFIIIISILILSSSTCFTPHFFLKSHKKPKLQKSLLYSDGHPCQSNPVDDDNILWSLIFSSQMDDELIPTNTTTTIAETMEETVSFPGQVKQEDSLKVNSSSSSTSMDENKNSNNEEDTWPSFFFSQPIALETTTTTFEMQEEEHEHSKVERSVEHKTEEEEDSMDAMWKVIMGSKDKESGPHLKKSETWSSGDDGKRDGDGGSEKSRGLRKYRVEVELKKWQSFRDMIERKQNYQDVNKPPKRAWKSMEMAPLTFHDEFKKRADAFIARFTHDFRLQRLESHQRFLDLINRAG